jgi:hypothetical protein
MMHQEALDTALRRASPEQRARFKMLMTDPNQPLSDSTSEAAEETETNRRDFVRGLFPAVATANYLNEDTIGRLTWQDRRSVDRRLIDDHEEFTDVLAGLHRKTRPDILLGPVTREADLVVGLLDRPASPQDRVRLYTVATGVCAQAGCLAFGIGERPVARRYFALARDIAEDSEDDTLHAQALGASSVLSSPLPQGNRGGKPERARAQLSEAVDHAKGADPLTRSWLNRWLALELAAAGDDRGFRFHMEQARASVAGLVEEGRGHFGHARDGAFGIDDERMDADTGLGLTLLGQADAALDMLSRALTPSTSSWGLFHATVLTDTAAAHILKREPEVACDTLGQAWKLTTAVGCPMAMERVRGVRERFPSSWTDQECVEQLDAEIQLPSTSGS